jgi:outer membrane protein TolC
LDSSLVKAEYSYEHLLELARDNRPLLAVYEQRSRASKLAATQAEWERRPDFTVWLGYRFRLEAGTDDGTDFLSIGAAIPLPFDYLGTTDAKKTEHLELAKASEQNKSGALDEIASGIEKSLAAWQRAVTQERTYRESLVPQAQKTLDAALLAYETDRTDFFSIYRAELDLIQFERTIRTARITTAQMKVSVEALVGRDLGSVTPEEKTRGRNHE